MNVFLGREGTTTTTTKPTLDTLFALSWLGSPTNALETVEDAADEREDIDPPEMQ